MQIININKQTKALLKYKLSLSRLCINLFGISLLLMPFLSFAESLPKSTITNNTETFQLSCPDNDPQGSTIEMMKCYTTKIEQLNAVEAKYIAAIYSRINTEQRDNPERLNILISSIVNENNRWDELIGAASLSMYNYWIDGSVRNLVGAQREIELKKYRIHNQWQSWLTYADSSGILPEPLFIEVNNTATE